MEVIVAMAGRGQRFRDQGYDCPKYEIMAKNRTLFYWSLISLKPWHTPENTFHFISLKEHDAGEFIKQEMADLEISNWTLTELESVTDGQATTVLACKKKILDPCQPILIYNIDTHITPSALENWSQSTDPVIPCFKAKGDHWSFVETNTQGLAVKTAEKERISDNASIGLYGFHSFREFEEAYEQSFLNANAPLKEKYIAPMYNYLIAQGKQFTVPILNQVDIIPLGTPDELNRFLKRD